MMVSSITSKDNNGVEWSGLKRAFLPCQTHITNISSSSMPDCGVIKPHHQQLCYHDREWDTALVTFTAVPRLTQPFTFFSMVK